jgi:hypothetical protein
MRVAAMVRAADALFLAGSPDTVDARDPHAAWEARAGGILGVFATDGGEKLAEYRLPAPPIWDGMAATAGRLFVCATDGSIVCLRRPDR